MNTTPITADSFTVPAPKAARRDPGHIVPALVGFAIVAVTAVVSMMMSGLPH